jgi:hypothetical protein
MRSEHRSHAAGLHKRCAIASPRQCRDNAIRRSIPPTTTQERCKMCTSTHVEVDEAAHVPTRAACW